MKRRNLILVIASVATAAIVGFGIYQSVGKPGVPPLVKLRFGVSPFQDTYLPVLGRIKGWYLEEGIDVEFKVLGWTEVMEALSAGQVDIAINNISSVVATHERNPEIIYWYGFNPFDNGFALMIRPNGGIKTLGQIEEQVRDHQQAVQLTAAQLKGKTVITTGKTDMEQGVAAAARRGGLDFRRDIRIIDLNPDEGLAAFLRGEGDAYIGGIPQRTRAGKEGMLEMLTGADLGPPPINGIVTTKAYARTNEETLLKVLHVWFRIVKYMNDNMEDGAGALINDLNAFTGAQFTVADFRRFWNNYEHFPASPQEVQELIIAPTGRNYWKARWDDCNNYFFTLTQTISKPVDPADAFWMLEAQKAYLMKYGRQ